MAELNKTIINPWRKKPICPSEFYSDQKMAYEILYPYLHCQNRRYVVKIIDKIFPTDMSNIVLEYLDDKDIIITRASPFCLLGSAGTGKTHLICTMIHDIILNDNNNVFVLAPTHKARSILSKTFYKTYRYEEKPGNLSFRTLASFLKQRIEYDKDGRSRYVSSLTIQKLVDIQPTHIFIDECSMIKKADWEDIKQFMYAIPSCRYLIIGDEYQLPPVNEKISPVFEDITQKIVLKEIIRTSKDDLKNLYSALRTFVNSESKNFPFAVYKGKNLTLLPKFASSIIRQTFDPKKDKIIAYRNKTVDELTKMVRNVLYDCPTEKYVTGERLMFQHYYEYNESKRFYSSYEFTATHVSIEQTPFKNTTFKTYLITTTLPNGDYVFRKIHNDDRERFDKYFDNLRRKLKVHISASYRNMSKKDISTLWKDFYNKKNKLDVPIGYSYATTVHKSQGSTYRKIYLDGNDISCVRYFDLKQYKRALYTAGTRASERIIYKQ